MTRMHLREPPIVEVVCGFVFEPVPGLDPVATGLYWHGRRAEYPTKQIQPAVGSPMLGLGVMPTRAWFVSENDERVIQVQQDRFYFNWRGRHEGYPHFNTYDGVPGVLDRCDQEFRLFASFCQTTLGRRPTPRNVELAKIDHLLQGKHWTDFDDLATALPVIAGARSALVSEHPVVQLQLFEQRDDREIHVQVNNALVSRDFARIVQIETRVVAPTGSDAKTTLQSLNELANKLFFDLVPKSQAHRFGGWKE